MVRTAETQHNEESIPRKLAAVAAVGALMLVGAGIAIETADSLAEMAGLVTGN